MNNLIMITKEYEDKKYVTKREEFINLHKQIHRAELIYGLHSKDKPTDIKYYIRHDFIGRFNSIEEARIFNNGLSLAIDSEKEYIFLELKKNKSFIEEYRIECI